MAEARATSLSQAARLHSGRAAPAPAVLFIATLKEGHVPRRAGNSKSPGSLTTARARLPAASNSMPRTDQPKDSNTEHSRLRDPDTEALKTPASHERLRLTPRKTARRR